MVAEGVALLEAVSSIRKDTACQVPVRGDGDWPEPAVSDAGLLPPTDVSPALCGAPSWVLSLRAEVEALRNEVRQVREEVEYWKAESHKHFCDAQYWRAMHQQALERIAQRDQEIERLKADVRGLRQQLFGRKTEKGKAGQLPQDLEKAPSGRRRGQQLGHAGHGRRDHSHLPAVVTFLDLPTDARCCPRCRQPYAEFPGTEDSETIEIHVRAHRRVICRKRYRRTCSCPGVPGIITAPAAPRLFAKGIVGISVWVMVLLDKFLFYRPTHRLLEDLRTYGVDLPAGTLTDGLKRFLPLLEPIYAGILAQSRRGILWSADETRWMVFVQIERKLGHRWYLWAFQSALAIAFELDPSRSHRVPDGHFQGVEGGILLVDRYAGYKAMDLVKEGTLRLAFCWAHVRRDFIGVAKNWPKLAGWSLEWLLEIRELYHLNRQRMLFRQAPTAFAAHDRRLRDAVAAVAAKRDEQLGPRNLHPACRKTLESLNEHWKGLTLFVAHPDVPMDNNRTERTQRGPVVGRKNYYGSGALWSGKLAAMLFSLFATLRLHEINPRQWLTAYLEACAAAGGKAPQNAADFLPWNLPAEAKEAMHAPLLATPEVNNSS
jgi:transposase